MPIITDNTLRELATAVAEMREAQREYFRFRRNLGQCLALERKVDRLVADILDPPKPRTDDKQMALDFGGGF